MTDKEATVQQLKDILRKFEDERDWGQFHDPKNVAEALVIEAGELLEQFLWKDKAQIAEAMKNPAYREEVADELADVLNYLLLISDTTGIDLATAMQKKLEKNALKYPVEKSRGKATKYTKL